MSQMPARSIRIPDSLWEPLKVQAVSIGSDASAVIRELIEEWLQQER